MGTERFPPVRRWRPVRPKQSDNNLNHSGEQSVPLSLMSRCRCRCRCRCSARLLETSTESNSESIEFCRTPQGKNQLRESEHDRGEEYRGLKCGTPTSLSPRQSVNPTWILTMPGFGGTANLQFPPLTLPLTLRIPLCLRGGGCQHYSCS